VKIARLVAVGLASALLWLAIATRPHNPTLEEARPPAVYDFFSYYRPNAAWAFGRMRHGELPLWNPLQGFGGPFLATLQTGVLYPPNALHLLLPTQPAFAWLAFAHLALAAVLAGGLARALGACGLGAALAGILYAGSMQLWTSVWWPPVLYTAAWAPGVLLAVVRAAERPTVRRAALLAGAVALQLLAGWPYVVAMTALAAAALGAAELAHLWLRERRPPLRAGIALALGAAAGAALAAPQLLPALELMARSARALGTVSEDPAQAIGAIPSHDPRYFARLLWSEGVSDGVPGILAPLLALAAVALPGAGRGRAAALLGVGLAALAASFPQHTPVYGWLRHLPVLGDFRFPFRYRLLTTLALAVCAGVGLARLEGLRGRGGRQLTLAVALLAVAVEAVPMQRSLGRAADAFPRDEPDASARYAPQLALLRGAGAEPFRSYWRIFGADKLGEGAGIRVTQDLEPLSLATTGRWMSFLATGDAGTGEWRARRSRLPLGVPYSGSIVLPADPARAPLLDRASVRYATGDALPAWITEGWRPAVAQSAAPPLYENPRALPRARRVSRLLPQPAEPQEALARIAESGARGTAWLDPFPREAADLGDAGVDPSARTDIVLDEPERVVIRTSGSAPAALVLADAWYPGWEATLDGAPAAIALADTAFRAVMVPEGEHRVEMRYRPRSFRLGIAFAAAAAAALLVAVGAGRRSTI